MVKSSGRNVEKHSKDFRSRGNRKGPKHVIEDIGVYAYEYSIMYCEYLYIQ